VWEKLHASTLRVAAALRRQQWRAALGELFALGLFHDSHDRHLYDHEMHCLRGADFIPAWFALLSRQWRAVLARSDAELGLLNTGCRAATGRACSASWPRGSAT
jgi:hypothetical protein